VVTPFLIMVTVISDLKYVLAGVGQSTPALFDKLIGVPREFTGHDAVFAANE